MLLAAVLPLSLLPTAQRCCCPSTAPPRAACPMALAKGGSSKRKSRSGGGGGFGKPPPATGGGFGAKPPTFDEVIATFKTRLPEDASVCCPCGSGEAYATCCQPFHDGQPVDSPERCLRSRFAAFAYRLPRHIISTTHPDNRDYRTDRVAWARTLNREGLFDDFDFVRLEVGDAEPGASEQESFLSFRATLRRRGGAEDEMAFSERSRFVRTKAAGWQYASGDVTTDVPGLSGTVLNN